MIYSPSKEEDRKMRASVLEAMEIMLRSYARFKDEKFLEKAKHYGKVSEDLKARIESHDYSTQDTKRKRIDNSLKELEKITP